MRIANLLYVVLIILSVTDAARCAGTACYLYLDDAHGVSYEEKIDIVESFGGEVLIELATLEWVDWFNNRRLLEPIGNVPPVEFEELYYSDQKTQVRVA